MTLVYDCSIYSTIIQSQPICDNTTSSIRCANGGLINIVSANYGRTSSTVCTNGYGVAALANIACYSDQSSIVSKICNLR